MREANIDANGGERRAAPTVRLRIDPDPRRLREALARLDRVTRALDPESRRSLRLLVTEVVARAAELRGPRLPGLMCLEVDILPRAIRVEASGPGLPPASASGEPTRELEEVFPSWAIDSFATRWGFDRRNGGTAVWFEVPRERERERHAVPA